MSAFDWIAENITDPLLSTVKPAAGTGATADGVTFGGDPELRTPDVDRAARLSEMTAAVNGAAQSASSSIDGAASTSFNPLDWLFGPEEKPARLEHLPLPDPDDLLPPEMRAEVERHREIERDVREQQREFDAKISQEPGFDESKAIYRRSAFRIGARHDTDSEARAIDPDAEVKLGTREERLEALNGFVQTDYVEGMQGPGEHMCGATSLMAAAMLAEGNDGVKTVLDMVNGNEDLELDEATAQQLAALTEGFDPSKPMTAGQLHLIQQGLHQHLRSQLTDSEREQHGGVGSDVIKAAIQDNPQMAEMFEKHDMSIANIDFDGERSDGVLSADHFVLQIGEPGTEGAMVYDPWRRRDGNQVVRGEDELRDYTNASTSNVGGRVIGPNTR